MKTFATLVFLAFTLFAIPVQGGQYLTEAQKQLLLEKSRALGSVSEKEHAKNASEQTNGAKQQSRSVKSRQTNSRYLGVISKPTTPQTSTVTNNSRTQSQSLQSVIKSADWGTPTYSTQSVQQNRQVTNTTNSNRPVLQDQRLANTAKARRSNSQNRQVAKSTRKKINWSGFFKNLSQIADSINHGLNQTSTGFNPYVPQPTNFTPQRSNQLIHTMSVGNQTINVGGNHQIRTWDVGNQTFGTFDSKEVKMYNFGNFSHGTIGGQKVKCHMAGGIQFCK